MTIEEVVRKVLRDEHADVVRESVRVVAQEITEAEVSGLLGAGCSPGFLQPRTRSERALVSVVQQAYVCGVSTRRVDQLVESLGLRISKSEVSRIAGLLDEQVDAFRQRPLEGRYPNLFVDAKVEKVRDGGRVQRTCVVLAHAVHETGRRDRRRRGRDRGVLARLPALPDRRWPGRRAAGDQRRPPRVEGGAGAGARRPVAALHRPLPAGASCRRCRAGRRDDAERRRVRRLDRFQRRRVGRTHVASDGTVAASPLATGLSGVGDLRLAAGPGGAALTWDTVASGQTGVTGHWLSPLSGGLADADLDTRGLSATSPGDYDMTVAPDDSVWIATADPALSARRIAPDGTTRDVELGDPAGTALYPRLAAASDGAVLATWFALDAGKLTPVSRRFGGDGTDAPIEAATFLATPQAAFGTLLWARASLFSDSSALIAAATIGGSSIWMTAYLDVDGPHATVDVPAQATVGSPVSFIASVTDRAGVGTVGWAFSDGGNATGTATTHTYASPGTYSVKLTATDAVGNATVVKRTIVVVSAPPGDQGNPGPGEQGNPGPGDQRNGGTPGRSGPIGTPTGAGQQPPSGTSRGGRARAALRVTKASRVGTRVTVAGTIASAATGRVTIAYAQRVGRRTVATRAVAKIRKGRWSATFRLRGSLARAIGRGMATVTVSYRGDARVATGRATHSVAAAKPKRRHPASRRRRG
jgi:hypothetical protein